MALRRTRMALRLAPVEDEMIEHLDDVEGGRPTYPYFFGNYQVDVPRLRL
jgi:hypothetical protein